MSYGFDTLDQAMNTLEEAMYFRGYDQRGWPLEGEDEIVERARAAIREFAKKGTHT